MILAFLLNTNGHYGLENNCLADVSFELHIIATI